MIKSIMMMCKNMMPLYIVLLLATQASSQELSSTLHLTAYGAQYAFENEMVVFRCVVRGTNSMAWTSDQYIGVGVRLPLFSVQEIGHEVTALGKDETVAVLVNASNGGDLVIVSELRIRVKSAYPVASVRCLNSGANTTTSTSFFLADTTLVTCDRQSVCPGDAVTCTCITGNSTSLAWISNGDRLMFTSDDALQTQRNVPGSSVVAVLTENSNLNGIGVIMSNITITASSSDSELLLTCENVDRTMTKPNIIPIPRMESCPPVNPTDEGTTPTDPGSENAPARNTCSGPIAAAVVVPIIIIVLVIILAIVIIIVAPKKIREYYEAQLKEKDQEIERLEAEKQKSAQELSDLRKEVQEKDGAIGTFKKDVETKTKEVYALKEQVQTMDGQIKQKNTELNDLKNSIAKKKESAIAEAKIEIEKMKEEAMENLEKAMKNDQKRVLDELETKMEAEIDEVLGIGKSGKKEQTANPAGHLKTKLKEKILAALTELNGTTDTEIKKASQTKKDWLIKRLYNSFFGSSS